MKSEVGSRKSARIDLGLSLLSQRCRPGVPLTRYDIAAWCGCSGTYIYLVETRALRKIRRRLNAQEVRDLAAALEQR